VPSIVGIMTASADQPPEDAVTSPHPTQWRRGSSCQNGACVEVAAIGEMIAVRNSAAPDEVVLISRENWRAFIAAIKAGAFDPRP
jgi:predicted secreted Zn-dependent protease